MLSIFLVDAKQQNTKGIILLINDQYSAFSAVWARIHFCLLPAILTQLIRKS